MEPGSRWCLPPRHAVHSACPSLSVKEPALQGVGAVEPVEELLPAGELVHCSAEARAVAAE